MAVGIALAVVVMLVLPVVLVVGILVLNPSPHAQSGYNNGESAMATVAEFVSRRSGTRFPATPPPALRPEGRTGDEAVLGYEWDALTPNEGEEGTVVMAILNAEMYGVVHLTGTESSRGAFAGVLLSAHNYQDTSASILPELIALRGPEGTLYPVSRETMASKLPLVADPLKPGRATTGILVFEVPPDLDLENCEVIVNAGTESEIVVPIPPGIVHEPWE